MIKEKVFDIPVYCGSGVYAIVNRSKMKAYIGKSGNIKYRAIEHENKIREGKHEIEELSNAPPDWDYTKIECKECHRIFQIQGQDWQ